MVQYIINRVIYTNVRFWKRCFLKTSVSNGIIYTKYTQNPHTIEPPFNIATQSTTYTVTACVSRWEPNGLNANNPCPAARQKQYWYFISLLRFSALKCKPNGQKNVVVLENLIIESLHMIETELLVYLYIKRRGSQRGTLKISVSFVKITL